MTLNDNLSLHFLFEGYKVQDEADHNSDATKRYSGFVNKVGEWYIMEQTTVGTTLSYRYFKGDSGYSTAWSARQSGTYDYFDAIFN